MGVSSRLDVAEGIGYCRLSGNHGFQQSVKAIIEAIVTAREQGLRALLVNLMGARGFNPPSVTERHCMVRAWAEAAQGMLRGAIVVSPEFVDPEKFGVVAAANFGLVGNVFDSEAGALGWLEATG